MCMHTGTASSDAAAQKGSSPSEIVSPPDGHPEMTTPLKPRALALRRKSTASSIPVEGIWAMPTSRLRSGAQNSSQRKSL